MEVEAVDTEYGPIPTLKAYKMLVEAFNKEIESIRKDISSVSGKMEDITKRLDNMTIKFNAAIEKLRIIEGGTGGENVQSLVEIIGDQKVTIDQIQNEISAMKQSFIAQTSMIYNMGEILAKWAQQLGEIVKSINVPAKSDERWAMIEAMVSLLANELAEMNILLKHIAESMENIVLKTWKLLMKREKKIEKK